MSFINTVIPQTIYYEDPFLSVALPLLQQNGNTIIFSTFSTDTNLPYIRSAISDDQLRQSPFLTRDVYSKYSKFWDSVRKLNNSGETDKVEKLLPFMSKILKEKLLKIGIPLELIVDEFTQPVNYGDALVKPFESLIGNEFLPNVLVLDDAQSERNNHQSKGIKFVRWGRNDPEELSGLICGAFDVESNQLDQ